MRYTNHGLSLNLFEAGQGEITLIFLHYFGGSSCTWQPVIRLLSAEYRCLALDLRGWGDSDAPSESECRVEDMAGDVGALVSALGLTSYTLVGHSMGGKVAQAFAASSPAGLEQLLLIAPSPLTPEPMSADDRDGMRAAYGSETAARQTLEKIACLPLSSKTIDAVIADNLRASRTAWEAWADIGSLEDLSKLAAQIQVPTHILSGTGDAVLTPDVLTREVVQRISGATQSTVPGAGHLLPLEAPEIVADWIRARF
ncbi:MAG: alpha/beta fold hydrolase [Janthinobacterium lividum]